MEKIFIFGLPHNGTTILRTIIGHIPRVRTIIQETYKQDHKIESEDLFDYILFKYPSIRRDYFKESYQDVHKIFIIRHPILSISSYNKRHIDKYLNDKKFIENAIKCWLEAAHAFNYYQDKNINRLHFIRYEDMFVDNHVHLKRILSNIGLQFTDEIFDNTKYQNFSHKNQNFNQVPKEKPEDTDHVKLRLYQVNQEFKNNNTNENILVNEIQFEKIINDKNVKAIYPDI